MSDKDTVTITVSIPGGVKTRITGADGPRPWSEIEALVHKAVVELSNQLLDRAVFEDGQLKQLLATAQKGVTLE